MIVKHLNINNLLAFETSTSLVLGTFDGVHVGHRHLVKTAFKHSENVAVLLIYTNKKITKEHQKSGVLTTLEDRINIFEKLKIKSVYLLNLDEELLDYSPADFVEKIIAPLKATTLIIGEDFRFGKGALGTPETLVSLTKGRMNVDVVVPLLVENEKISTSLIKSYLLSGETFKAKRLLGAYYRLTGLVTKGFGLGSKLGYPTANVALDPSYFLPRHGVYFVRVKFANRFYFGMASLGYHPTVNEVNFPLLEVNIFDFDQDIYHRAISVEFLRYIRPELKLDSLDALVAKIEEDRAACYKYINEGDF